MKNFTYYNPVKIVFGKDTINTLSTLIEKKHKILLVYGKGSIKKNGIYEQVVKALSGYEYYEFGGIGANPDYETLMKAVTLGKEKNISFILCVGGGSVIDGTKFISAALCFKGDEPWDILSKYAKIESAIPFGTVLTIPATGSEMNDGAVISKISSKEKLVFQSPLVFPQFSILDPQATYSLPEKQIINGIVDAYIHVFEQYLTQNINTPLQDRQSEAILKTLIEEAPKVLENLNDYDVRANIMWCATHALNKNLSCGVISDWATHMIGHEVTAIFGLDHAQTLACIMPSLLRYQKDHKLEKVKQYGKRVWGLSETDDLYEKTIEKTEQFFNSIGMPTKLSHYKIDKDQLNIISERFKQRGMKLGEKGDLGFKEVQEILENSY
jgi:NADP-dependent alcohol dehydrogenase